MKDCIWGVERKEKQWSWIYAHRTKKEAEANCKYLNSFKNNEFRVVKYIREV